MTRALRCGGALEAPGGSGLVPCGTYLAEREGKPCTKAEIAEALGRNRKTIDRLISQLRAEGLLVSQAMWSEDGGQLANIYRLGREG